MRRKKVTKRIGEGFKVLLADEKSVGIILVACAVISLFISNSIFGADYRGIFTGDIQIFHHSIEHWINDALMAVFFLLVGLDLKEEFIHGNLSDIKDSLLPVICAIGGMLVPAGIYAIFNVGGSFAHGFGIPMATDIAFAVGMLSLLGKRVPTPMKTFLLALAVIDDLGAIVVIALFYSQNIFWGNLAVALGTFVLLMIANHVFNIKNLFVYVIGGIIMWWFMLHSGVHATIAGVLLAVAIPFDREKIKGSEWGTAFLQKVLEKPVNFIILPLFALANTAILIQGDLGQVLSHNYSLGIIGGLVIGKPLGITITALILISIGVGKLPNQLNWKQFIGVSFLAGIGFTMSIFVTKLSFTNNEAATNNSILVIMIASLIASIFGLILLNFFLAKGEKKKKSVKS